MIVSPETSLLVSGDCSYGKLTFFRYFAAFLAQKCKKNGHFSLEKAFSSFFLAMVLARTINFAEEKQQKMKEKKI